MKYNTYYGNEENAYEVEKNVTNSIDDAINIVSEYLENDLEFVEDKNEFKTRLINEIKKGISNDGYGFAEFINQHEYHIVIGIAPDGKCRELRNYISDFRKEMLSYY